MSSSPLIDLPSELRQIILQHALRQKGTIELQLPVWTGYESYVQSLFHVCKRLRLEALEAFYTTNDFLWILDPDQLRSDPSAYPHERFQVAGKPLPDENSVEPPPLTQILPWQYPYLFTYLRHLQVNLILPGDGPVRHVGPPLREQLTAMVNTLENGKRLSEFHVLITAKRRAPQTVLSDAEREALEVLAQMQVRGSVDVHTRWYFRGVFQGVQEMRLKERMVRRD